jgi:hypothetical protein
MDSLIFLALLALGFLYFIYAVTAPIFGVNTSGRGFLGFLLAMVGLSWLFGGDDGDAGGDC